MAQNVTIAGASYTDVSVIEVPKTTSGVASYNDVSDTTATASDVASGKYFYTAAGVKTVGTATGAVITETALSDGGTLLEISGGLDLSNDTVTSETLLQGYTAHDRSGASITGSALPGGELPEKDVNFRDYDGTIVASYTASEFASLTNLPDNPVHTGLTSQGWNWSLNEAKTYVATYGMLEIGQMYITNDGKTRLYVTIDDPLVTCFKLALLVNGTVNISWGDGSPIETLTGTSFLCNDLKYTQPHTYSALGDYVITIWLASGNGFSFGGNGYGTTSLLCPGNIEITTSTTTVKYLYSRVLKKIEIGSNFKRFDIYAIADCVELKTITLPIADSTISLSYMDQRVFSACLSLVSITIPIGVVSIDTRITGDVCYTFLNCRSLKCISLPRTITTLGAYVFAGNMVSLKRLTLPDSITSKCSYLLYNSQSMLTGGNGLKKAVIPNSVNTASDSLQSAFNSCSQLEHVVIPNNATSIPDSMFYYCPLLKSVTIPDTVTTIGPTAFYLCASLSTITIPQNVTSIGTMAFGASSLQEIHFRPSSPPALSSSSSLDLRPNCKIYVPTGSLNAYTSATNYPNPSTYTYIEE